MPIFQEWPAYCHLCLGSLRTAKPDHLLGASRCQVAARAWGCLSYTVICAAQCQSGYTYPKRTCCKLRKLQTTRVMQCLWLDLPGILKTAQML